MKGQKKLLGALIVGEVEYPVSLEWTVTERGAQCDLIFENTRKEPDITFRPADWRTDITPRAPSEGTLTVIGILRI